MSCSPCTSCEDCREVKYVWPGCLTSSEIDPDTNLPYQFSVNIPIYILVDGALEPVPANQRINVRFKKLNGAERILQYLVTEEGIFTYNGTNGISSEDNFSDGFFNAEAGIIEMTIFTDEGIPVLILDPPEGSSIAFQCTYCLLINYATGSLPISTLPFEFTGDFVQCEFEMAI